MNGLTEYRRNCVEDEVTPWIRKHPEEAPLRKLTFPRKLEFPDAAVGGTSHNASRREIVGEDDHDNDLPGWSATSPSNET